MNTNFYATYPNITPEGQTTISGGQATIPSFNQPGNQQMLNIEQSYIENILRLNKGKLATFYFSYPDSVEWRDKKYTGIIEAAGRDHIIIRDPKSGKWFLLLMLYLNYVEFNEKINYSPEYYIPN